jgi:hypothetical protein
MVEQNSLGQLASDNWREWLTAFQAGFNPGMSQWQIANFVVARGGETPYGRWVQCCRELFARLAGLTGQSRVTQHQADDLCTLLGLMLAYRQQFDQPTQDLEICEWVATARAEAGCELLANGRVSMQTWRMLRALPHEHFIQLANEIATRPQELVAQYIHGRIPPAEPVDVDRLQVNRALLEFALNTPRIEADSGAR